MIIVTVSYPKTPESHFNLDYYLQKHIPFVKSSLEGLGLNDLRLMRGTTALDGGPPHFELIAQLLFTSIRQIQDALAQHGEKIIADIPNFTNIKPLIQFNEPL